MASRLRQPTEQEMRDLAMTLAGEIDLSRSPLDSPETRTEAANILATVVNRFSTDEPHRFGRSQVRQYSDYSDVVRNAGQYNAWMGQHAPTTQRNYEANQGHWDQVVEDFFEGDLEPSAPNATHYHATQVSPDWSREYERVGQSGPHIFYNDETYMGRPLGQHRPAYAMAEFTGSQTQAVNPENDFTRQEIAAIAPPTPASGAQMRQAKALPNPTPPVTGSPIANRTLGGYIDQSQVTLGPRANPIGSLTPEAQRMVQGLQERSGLPEVTINHGMRTDADHARLMAAHRAGQGHRPASSSQHRTGNAVDINLHGLTAAQRATMLDAAIYGGAREIGATNTMLHAGIPRSEVGENGLKNGFRDWGYSGRTSPSPWVNESQNYRDLQQGRQYFRQGTPTPRPDTLSAPQSTFPARSSTPAGLPAAPTLPQRSVAETAPRLSETYAGRAGISRSTMPSSFPARPSMGTGGLPAAPSSGLDTMRAQSDQIMRETSRPQSGPFPVSRPQTAPQMRSPTDFQYAARSPAPPQQRPSRPTSAPQPASQRGFFSGMTGADYRSPVQAPQASSIPRSTMAQQYGMRALESAPRTPQVPNPVASPVVPGPVSGPTVPNPMARPDPTAPNPMPRPGNIGPMVGPIASPMPRTRARSVPNPMAAPNAPRQQNVFEQAFSGFNDWASGLSNAPRQVGQSVQRVVAPTFAGINAGLNTLTGNAPNARAPEPWQVHTGSGGSRAYGGRDQPSTQNARSTSGSQGSSWW